MQCAKTRRVAATCLQHWRKVALEPAKKVAEIAARERTAAEEAEAKKLVAKGKAKATSTQKVTRGAIKSVAFKRWVMDAVGKNGVERVELYAFLAECFKEADSDRDGLVNVAEFDCVVENTVALPRRFGLAPSWKALYGDLASRQTGLAKLFRTIDVKNTNKIGIENWTQYAFQHIAEKVKTMS